MATLNSTRSAPVDEAGVRLEGGWRALMRLPVELDVAKADWSSDRIEENPELALAHAFQLAKVGDPSRSRNLLNRFRSLIEEGRLRGSGLESDFILVDTHVRVYEDRLDAEADTGQLNHLLLQLPPDDRIGQALTLNHLSSLALRLGEFDTAQHHAEQAIRLYKQDGAEFGSLHLHTHLGQIRMMRGDLSGAERQYDEMESCLAELPGNPEGLRAICKALKSEVAYEMNELDAAEDLLSDAMQIVEDADAWPDVLAASYRVRIRLAFVRAGLPGALTELSHAESTAHGRNLPRLASLMRIERIRALTLSDEPSEALKAMGDIGVSVDNLSSRQAESNWELRHGTTNVAIARWLVRTRRSKQAIGFLDIAEEIAIRGSQLLSLAKLRVIRANAHWRLNARMDATGALLSAIRLLRNQPFRRFILDEGIELQPVVQAALNGYHARGSISAWHRRRLAEIMHSWSAGRNMSGDSGIKRERARIHRQYLGLLALGYSNKEIGRTMGVSENTVKYHLKQLYLDLQVDNRTRAVHCAREQGLLDS